MESANKQWKTNDAEYYILSLFCHFIKDQQFQFIIFTLNDYNKYFFSIPEKIPTRFNVGVMLFMACFISYMLRVNISINILAMVEPTNLHENKTLAAAPDVSNKIYLSLIFILTNKVNPHRCHIIHHVTLTYQTITYIRIS